MKFLTDSPVLPRRFVAPEYDLALFFDFSLRVDSDFFRELQENFKVSTGLMVLSSNRFEFLANFTANSVWSDEIRKLNKRLQLDWEYHGICVVEEHEEWLIAQHLNISMGVALFKGLNPNATALFERMRSSDWFFDVDYVEAAARDKYSGLASEYGDEFLNLLVENYSTKLSK